MEINGKFRKLAAGKSPYLEGNLEIKREFMLFHTLNTTNCRKLGMFWASIFLSKFTENVEFWRR